MTNFNRVGVIGSRILTQESLDSILNSMQWFNFVNMIVGIIPYTSKATMKRPKCLKLRWFRYIGTVIMYMFISLYTTCRIITESGFSMITMGIALAVCAMATIQGIVLLNSFGRLATRYFRLIADADVVFTSSGLALTKSYYKGPLKKDLYVLIYMFLLSALTRASLFMEVLNFDFLQYIALLLTTFANCYVKLVFVSLGMRISQRFSMLNKAIDMLKICKSVNVEVIQGEMLPDDTDYFFYVV